MRLFSFAEYWQPTMCTGELAVYQWLFTATNAQGGGVGSLALAAVGGRLQKVARKFRLRLSGILTNVVSFGRQKTTHMRRSKLCTGAMISTVPTPMALGVQGWRDLRVVISFAGRNRMSESVARSGRDLVLGASSRAKTFPFIVRSPSM
ncbi:MAG: hypothetical protein EPN46_11580 [Candidimonas sp.]|nr:MAG: hypothetical protein EPN46_11580 [Candidimonas sp.]